MTLIQLRHLIAIVDAGLNLTVAAERVHATQPGLSKQLKALEDELGFPVFLRNGKRLTGLTELGAEVAARARLIVDQARSIRAELVALDCRRGLVTREGALRYGVVLGAHGVLDSDATQKLRARIEAERPPIQLFDRGGTIEELRARCKEETHLEPPKPPVFAKWMKKSGAFA